MGNPRYKIGRYISIYRCDDLGNIGEVYIAEARTLAKLTFNYYHGPSDHIVGTQDDLEGLYLLGEEVAKLFSPEAIVLRPNTIEELYSLYADCFLNPKPGCMSERIVRHAHGEAFISM